MTLRRKIINTLDRPGGYHILGWVGTRMYRKLTGEDVSIFWDGSWFGRHEDEYISDGIRFEYYRDSFINRSSAIRNLYSNARDFWFYKYNPGQGDVIVDVGAGSGHETILLSKSVGNRGLVLAVEAHPTTFDRLQKTCKYNKLDNVNCLNLAIMDKSCELRIDDNVNDEANAVSSNRDGEGYLVKGVSLDELCNNQGIERINLLKMNIEGAEQWAIQGMTEIIGKIDHVAIACHDFLSEDKFDESVCTREKVCVFLKENGFNYTVRSNDNRPYVRDHVHAWRQI